jgi:hypothetical protein
MHFHWMITSGWHCYYNSVPSTITLDSVDSCNSKYIGVIANYFEDGAAKHDTLRTCIHFTSECSTGHYARGGCYKEWQYE